MNQCTRHQRRFFHIMRMQNDADNNLAYQLIANKWLFVSFHCKTIRYSSSSPIWSHSIRSLSLVARYKKEEEVDTAGLASHCSKHRRVLDPPVSIIPELELYDDVGGSDGVYRRQRRSLPARTKQNYFLSGFCFLWLFALYVLILVSNCFFLLQQVGI